MTEFTGQSKLLPGHGHIAKLPVIAAEKTAAEKMADSADQPALRCRIGSGVCTVRFVDAVAVDARGIFRGALSLEHPG